MAAPHKQGLDYFPLDIDFFDDDKVQLVSAEFGLKAEAIALRLMALVYKNGYWYRWGADECLLLAKRVGESGSFVGEVVKGLVRRSFFDEGVFNSFQVLTSRGVQVRYFNAVERRKEVNVWEGVTLIDVKPLMKHFNVSINYVNASINPQSRVEDSKKKKEESIGLAATSAAGDQSEKKLRSVTPHWEHLKNVFINFYADKFDGLEPSMNGGSAAALKSILKRLQKHSSVSQKTKDLPWTEEYAGKVFLHFLTKAYADKWRAQNFRLTILSSHYDSIITNTPHESGSKNGTGGLNAAYKAKLAERMAADTGGSAFNGS